MGRATIRKYTITYNFNAQHESEVDGDGVGISVPDSDVEDVPSVVRVVATPDTVGPDAVGFGV